MSAVEPLDVVAGVLGDDAGRVLVAKRPAHKHHGGLWEFPGGKREPGEAPDAAIRRELQEELGIAVGASVRLMHIHEARPGRPLLLRVMRVLSATGAPRALEHEALAFVFPNELGTLDLAPADRIIARRLASPRRLAITPGPERWSPDEWLVHLDAAIQRGFDRLHLRGGAARWADSLPLAERIAARVAETGMPLAVHDDPALALHLGAATLHLSSALAERLVIDAGMRACWTIGLSVHADTDPDLAQRLSPDYVLVGNVAETASHPGRPGIGWHGFRLIADRFDAPAYAIGGLGPDDADDAHRHGALGWASISAWF